MQSGLVLKCSLEEGGISAPGAECRNVGFAGQVPPCPATQKELQLETAAAGRAYHHASVSPAVGERQQRGWQAIAAKGTLPSFKSSVSHTGFLQSQTNDVLLRLFY